MTRQQAYQQRHRLLGLCTNCPRPVFKKTRMCKFHLWKARLAGRIKMQCQPQWLTGKGRPATFTSRSRVNQTHYKKVG